MPSIGSFSKHVEYDVIRRVLRLANFLNNDPAFAFNLIIRHGRVGQDIGQDIDTHIQIFGQQAQIIGGFFTAGMGVHIAARILDLGGDITR